jgi:hypothetical protein
MVATRWLGNLLDTERSGFDAMVFYAGIRLGIRRIQTQIRERLPTPSRDAAQRSAAQRSAAQKLEL